MWLLDFLQLGNKVPVFWFGYNLIRPKNPHFVEGWRWVLFRWQSPADDFIFFQLHERWKLTKKTLKWQQQTQEQLFCSICFLDECTIMDIIKQIKLTLLTTCNIRKNSILPHTLPVTRIIFHHQQNRKSVFLQNCCDQHEKTFQY